MILKRIEVFNFMTLRKFEWDIKNNFNLIYGENGAGKSTIIDIFDYLLVIFRKPMIQKEFILQMEKKEYEFGEELNILGDIYENYATRGFKDNVEVSFDFEYKSKKGDYKIVLNKNNEIVYELLRYAGGKKIAKVFLRDEEKISYNEELKNYFKRYNYHYENNKNSIIAIFNLLFSEEEIDYEDNMSLEVINHLANSIVHNHKFHRNRFHTSVHGFLVKNYRIKPEQKKDFEKILDEQIEDFSNFVRDIDDKIFDISYQVENSEKYIDYIICSNKRIDGQEAIVPFNLESSGTQIYMEYYNLVKMISNEKENLFLWDEIDLHLHSNLATKLIEYVYKQIKKNNKQLIMTTHNLSWLNNKNIKNKEKNIIIVNPANGIRKIQDLQGEDVKDNFTRKYELGLYGGVPSKSDIYWEPDGN